MRNWNGICQRCYKESRISIMSMFSEALICMDCKDAEKKRTDYKQAEAKDLNEYAGRLRGLGMAPQAENVERLANTLMKEED